MECEMNQTSISRAICKKVEKMGFLAEIDTYLDEDENPRDIIYVCDKSGQHICNIDPEGFSYLNQTTLINTRTSELIKQSPVFDHDYWLANRRKND
jgi:hypothetical protein